MLHDNKTLLGFLLPLVVLVASPRPTLPLTIRPKPPSTTTSVIIVGAGAAGIAAATRLLEHNITDLVILEAEDRIGGRVNSIKIGESYVDLGAESCHGEKQNVVYDLVKDLNVLRHSDNTREICHSARGCIDQKFTLELVSILDNIYTPDGNRNFQEGEPLANYCIQQFNSTIYQKFQDNQEKLNLARQTLELFHHAVLGQEGAFTWFEPSAKSDYRKCEGDSSLSWNGKGFKTVLEVLMKKIPDPNKQLPIDNRILLGKEVTQINWADSSVSCLLSDGSTYQSDHVIFTPSIGVLKEQSDKMFNPKLPEAKLEAIKNIGFGAVMKVIMHFPQKWWIGRNFSELFLVWSDKDKEMAAKEFPKGPINEQGRSWLTYFFSIIPAAGSDNVLIGWITGDLVPEIERIPKRILIEGLDYIMNKFFGKDYNVTRPDIVISTKWFSNQHFRGSYSFQTVESRRNNVSAEVELAKPLLNWDGRPVVQFAGEASHPYFYSTVHGAIETGFREADRIIDLYK